MKKSRMIAALLCAGTLLGAAEWEVISARLNAGPRSQDVTEALRGIKDSGARELKVHESVFGDPPEMRRRRKRLELEAGVNGEVRKINVDAGCVLPLDPARWDDPDYRISDLQREIEAAYARGEKRFTVKPGTYRLPGTKRQADHLVFWNMKDFEIDASGVTFVFEEPDQCGISFNWCENLTFKGAEFRWEYPGFSQGTLLAVGGDYVDVKVAEGYPDFSDPKFGRRTPVLNFYDRSRRIRPAFEGETNIRKIEKLGDEPGVWRIFAGTRFLKTAQAGDPVAWRRQPPTNRGSVNIDWCSGCTFADIVLHSGAVSGIKESVGTANRYFRCRVEPAPEPPKGAKEKPLLADSADGFFCQIAKKGPILEKCVFDGTHDDGICINGKLWTVTKADGCNAEFGSAFLPDPGDEFHFFDEKHMFLGKRKALESVFVEGLVVRSRFDGPVPEGARTVSDADWSGRGFIIRDCVTRNHRGRGILICSAAGGVVENCLFENINKMAIHVSPEFLTSSLGPYAADLTIRNNTIRHCSADPWGSGGVVSVGSLNPIDREKRSAGPHAYVAGAAGHSNIVIEGNRFEDCLGPNLDVVSATQVTVKDNLFINPMKRAVHINRHRGLPVPDALIFIAYDKDITFSGNKVVNPGPEMKQKLSVGADVTGLKTDM